MDAEVPMWTTDDVKKFYHETGREYDPAEVMGVVTVAFAQKHEIKEDDLAEFAMQMIRLDAEIEHEDPNLTAEVPLQTTADVEKLLDQGGEYDEMNRERAKAAAGFVHFFRFYQRFGAMEGDYETIVFANMGCTEPMLRAITRFKEAAAENGWKLRGESWCSDQYTWAAILDPETPLSEVREELADCYLDEFKVAR